MGDPIHISPLRFNDAATASATPAEEDTPAVRTDVVHVVYTSIDETLAAVRVAGDVARGLGAPVSLVPFRTVPYALPADRPDAPSPVETDAFVDRLRATGCDVSVRVYLCREERRALQLAFKPHSLIVIGGRARWWPGSANRWRRLLAAAGHSVLFVSPERRRLRLRIS
jgi:hypothetical protein